MRYNIKIIAGLILASTCLLLAACFIPLGEKQGGATFTINLGGGGRMAYGPSAPGGAYPTISDLKYVVEFTPAGSGLAKTVVKDGPKGDSITDTIETGVYNVKLNIYLRVDGSLYASGGAAAPSPNPVKIESGSNIISVQVSMDPHVRGNGSISNPFKVYDAATLNKVGSGTDGWTLSAHYILIQNINIAEQSFTPIGDNNAISNNFTGTFNGNNKTISGLTIDSAVAGGQGLFGAIGGAAEIKNLTLTGVNIGATTMTSVYNGGGIAGQNNGATVKNCNVSGIIKGFEYIGGVVGNNDGGTVENCSFVAGSIFGYNEVGGITGCNSGELIGCIFTGVSVNSEGSAGSGGIVGYNSGLISYCYASGDVSGETSGGVAGSNYSGGIIEKCYYASGTIAGGANGIAGGIAGDNYGTVQNCYSAGSISATDGSGGIVAWNYGPLQNCYSTASVSGEDRVGGVTGENSGGDVQNCVAVNTAIIRTGGTMSTFGRVMGSSASGPAINNYARSDMITPHTPYPNSDADGASITEAQWGDTLWWMGTVLFTDPWWTGRLPPIVP